MCAENIPVSMGVRAEGLPCAAQEPGPPLAPVEFLMNDCAQQLAISCLQTFLQVSTVKF